MSDPIFDKLLASEQNQTGGAAPSGTLFDSLMGIEQRKSQQFLGQIDQAVGVNPDKYSADKQTARLLARPVAAVEALPEDAARDAKVKTLQDNTANAPVLKQQYTDADFAKLAHDDSAPLSAIEALVGAAKYVTSAPDAPRGGLLSDIGMAARSIVSGAPRLSGGIWGAGAAVPGLLGLTDAEQWMLQQQKNAQGLANRIQGLDPKAGLVERSVMSGFQSAGQNLVMLPFGLARGATEVGTNAILTMMGISTGGESYAKAREKGVSPYQAAAYGIEDAAAEVVFEKYFGIGGFLQNVKAGAGAGKLFVYELSKELPGEVATTLVQNFNEWGNVNPDKSVAQFLSEQPEAIAQTVISTLVGGGTQIGAIKTAEKVLGTFADPEAQMQQAEAQRAMLEQLSALAASSKLKARDTETFERFMDAATDGTPVQDLYIGASVLAQSGIAEQLAQALPTVAEQLPAALASDGFVRIPTAQYAAVIAGSEFEQSIIDHVKVDPNGYTFAESKEYAASFNQEMQTQLEKALVEREGDQAFKAERDQVREDFLGQLNQAKRFTEDVNGAYASMLANFYAVTAAKLGMTPRELVDRYQLNVAGREQRAAQFDQEGNLKTDTPEFKAWFGDWSDPKAFTSKAQGPVSQAVGKDGKPLTLYHATNDSFDTFETGRKTINATTFGDDLTERHAVFATPDISFAEEYLRGNSGANVMPVFMSIKSPMDLREGIDGQTIQDIVNNSDGGIVARDFYYMTPGQMWQLFDGEFGKKFVDAARRAGYDGAILREESINRETNHDVYAAFEPAQIKSATGNRGTFDPTDANILNQFAGPNAKTADIYALATAEERLAKKESAERVRKETGWFQGVDGMWRFEIADDEAKFKTNAALDESVQSEIKIVPDPSAPNLFKATYREGADDYRGAWGRTEEEARKNMLRLLAKETAGFDIAKVKAGDELFLSDVLDHPKLYAAYPDLADLLVTFVEGVDYRGQYSPRGDRIQIAISGDQAQMLSTLLHEVQHAIQEREGFAKGGNTDSTFTELVKAALDDLDNDARKAIEQWKSANQEKLSAAERAAQIARYGLMWESAQRLIDYANRDKPSGVFRLIRNEMQWIYSEDMRKNEEAQDLQRAFYGIPRSGAKRNQYIGDMSFRAARLLLDTIPKDLQQQFKDDPRTMKGMLNALQRESDKARKALAPLRDLEKTQRSAANVKEAHKYSTPFQIYQALAGEVEARNTQARQQMTEEERRATSPAATADVPAERTVVMFGGLDIQAPMAAFPQTGGAVLNQGPRGQIFFGQDITETPSVISLLKNADLSTFIHESGHFFLQVQADLAARIQAQINEGATVTDGERSIVEDMAKLLDWMGVKADQDGSALDAWMRMTTDEQRSAHEKFARGFEAYAFEGRAPTMELQGIFQRFRAWLLNLYRELKALNVELTDEVRGVMDRMLATNEQIEAAEAARNMGPLFNAQNAQGLIDDWQAYHELANEATLAAVDQLQAKSLKELQWASRARARVLKDLQKQHSAIRAELMMESRREVMSQPVYRAWQFLTGKLSKEDRAALKPEAERKSLPGTLDPSLDSLFVAIAKLGGLDRAQVESTWGWDKKERSPSPVFGKPLLRREGGRGLDAMGELLADYGYLPKDEHGKYDMADFEEAFEAEYRGTPVYSIEHDYANAMGEYRPGEGLSLENIGAGRFDVTSLKMVGVDDAVIDRLAGYGMTGKDGIHPDIVADLIVDEQGVPVFSSGNELAQRLAEAVTPKVAIEKLTDQKMLERFGELATPESRQQAADEAVHNELRAKMLHAEARALERAMEVKAPGKRGASILPKAARDFAQRLIAGLKVRDLRPAQYAAAEVRAAKAAERAFAKNELEVAAEQKRIQIVNNYATREAYAAQDEVRSAVAYLRKFEKRSKSLDPDYYDQIVAILERFDLVPSTTLKAIDKRTSLAGWLTGLEEQGIVPDIPAELAQEAFRKSYKDMTVEELRGLRDTIKQIDHMGRLKAKLLTAQDEREFAAIRDEIAESIRENSKGRIADNRTPNTVLGEKLGALKKFWASHIKAATWARIMDGGQDGGPVWEYLIRTANAAGDKEVGLREQATKELSALVAPVLAEGKMGGKGEFFPSIGRSLNKEARLAIALNIGNESNAQRLLGGEGWTVEQIKPVLDTLTTADWRFVQSVWDYFESYRPEIAAKERRVYGAEPQWIEARPLTVQTRDGDTLNLRGGYYPVKYDPRASERAESHMEAEDAKRMMQGAYTSATTRRSFTKQRADAVVGRPLLYSLDGLYNGVNEVIHDLSWHEWLIDANRIIKNPKIAEAMRDTYGAEVHQQFKNWLKDVAEGERGAQKAGEDALAWIRQGTSVAGLGLNVMSALMQPFGITQSWVRVGGKWIGRGISKAIADPVGTNAEINEMSEFMRTRSLTRMRELAELRNQVKGQTKTRANIDAAAYALMLRAQQLVDVPTWWGAYEKAIAEGNGQERAAALADQAVIDAQGGGTVKDLSAIERGGPALKLFTTFYSFMNTSLNLGVAQAMTRESKAKLAADMLLIYVAPVILIELMKSAFTPGDSGDWEDPEKAALKMLKAEVSYLFGLVFGLREMGGIVDAFQGKPGGEYSGPAGTRIIGDTLKLAKQIGQGEMDDGLRKSIVNVTGELLRLPAAQVNRSITGAKALIEGDTQNPAALVFGYEEPH